LKGHASMAPLKTQNETRRARRVHRLLGLAAALAATAALAPATALASGSYTFLSGSGFTVPQGTHDIGNHCDDCTTLIHLPFAARLFGQRYTQALVSSNGNVQFTAGTNPTQYINSTFPDTELGAAIAPYWDDLNTDRAFEGIFTRTKGSGHQRTFIIEWRA